MIYCFLTSSLREARIEDSPAGRSRGGKEFQHGAQGQEQPGKGGKVKQNESWLQVQCVDSLLILTGLLTELLVDYLSRLESEQWNQLSLYLWPNRQGGPINRYLEQGSEHHDRGLQESRFGCAEAANLEQVLVYPHLSSEGCPSVSQVRWMHREVDGRGSGQRDECAHRQEYKSDQGMFGTWWEGPECWEESERITRDSWALTIMCKS